MKTIRSAILLLLALCLAALPLVSCADTATTQSGVEVPAGMQDATGDGQGYAFFVPSGWTVDFSTGITVASVSALSGVNVTLAIFPSDASPEEYWAQSRDEIAAKFTDFRMEEEAGTTLLDGAAALRYHYGGTYYTGTAYRQLQYLSRHAGNLFVLTCTAPESQYDQYRAQFDAITDSFRFLDGTVVPGADGNAPGASDQSGAPDGMKDISDPAIHAYRLFVPDSWRTDMQTGICSAYVSDSDRSSISLTCYYPSNSNIHSIRDYWDALQKSYASLYTDYRVLSTATADTAIPVAGTDGAPYTFSGTNGGVSYRVLQVFFLRGSYIYTFTYTATDALFDTHMPEVEQILASLSFR